MPVLIQGLVVSAIGQAVLFAFLGLLMLGMRFGLRLALRLERRPLPVPDGAAPPVTISPPPADDETAAVVAAALTRYRTDRQRTPPRAGTSA